MFARWARHPTRHTLICESCTGLGYATHKNGTQEHRCDHCSKSFGPAHFDARALHNKNQRPDATLTCLTCRLYKCTVCGVDKLKTEFSRKQMDHHVTRGWQLRCTACEETAVYACAAPPCAKQKFTKPETAFDKVRYPNT